LEVNLAVFCCEMIAKEDKGAFNDDFYYVLQGWGGPTMNQGPPPNMMGGPGKGPGPQPNVPPQAANPTAGPRPHTSPHYLKQHLQVHEPCHPDLHCFIVTLSTYRRVTVRIPSVATHLFWCRMPFFLKQIYLQLMQLKLHLVGDGVLKNNPLI